MTVHWPQVEPFIKKFIHGGFLSRAEALMKKALEVEPSVETNASMDDSIAALRKEVALLQGIYVPAIKGHTVNVLARRNEETVYTMDEQGRLRKFKEESRQKERESSNR